jgi:hypothetical protein
MSTARVANVPSVVSNVMLGMLVAALAGRVQIVTIPWASGFAACLAGVLLYVAGNFFNDWMDQAWDAERRPERALPSGDFRSRTYARIALILGFSGVLTAACAGIAAAQVAGWIVFGVIAYTVWHKRSPWAVCFMGLCRALLVWLGAAVFSPDSLCWDRGVAFASAAVWVYVAGLSLAARRESRLVVQGFHWWDAVLLVVLSASVPALMLANPDVRALGLPTFAGVASYGLWLVYCQRVRIRGVGVYVSSLLAGIPLVDWILLLPMGVGILSSRGSASFAVGLAAVVVPPLALVAALLLQRLAPAT